MSTATEFLEVWQRYKDGNLLSVSCNTCGDDTVKKLTAAFSQGKIDPDTYDVWDLEMAIERARLRKIQNTLRQYQEEEL